MALSVPAAVVAMQGSDLLRGTRRNVRPSGNQIADRILFARSVLMLVVVVTAGLLVGRVEVFVAGWVVAWIVAAWLIVRVGGWGTAGKALDWGTVGRLVRFGVVQHIPVTLAPVFIWIGIVGVGILAGRAEAGMFGTAAAIVDTLLLVGVAVRLVGFPWLQGSGATSSGVAASMSRVATSAVFSVAVIAATVVPWLIPFAYGPAFGESVRIVWWFLPGVVAAVPAVAVTVFLQATDRAGRAAWVWLGSAVGFVVWVGLAAGSGGWLVAAGFSVIQILLLVALVTLLEQLESSVGWLVVRSSDLTRLRPSSG
jgi:O-antigen/teichoic acid export membrane protein